MLDIIIDTVYRTPNMGCSMNTKNDALVLLLQSVCMLCGTFPLQLLLLKNRNSSLSLNGNSPFCPRVGREGVLDEMAEQAAAAPSTDSISQCHMSGSWTNNAPLSTLTKLGVWPCEAAEHWSLRNCARTHQPPSLRLAADLQEGQG